MWDLPCHGPITRSGLAKRHKVEEPEEPELESAEGEEDAEELGELIPQDTLVCALTGALRPDKPEERVLQSLVEQLHREYLVELSDMERDVKVQCLNENGKKKTVTVAIAVYEHSKPHDLAYIIRVALIAKSTAKVSGTSACDATTSRCACLA